MKILMLIACLFAQSVTRAEPDQAKEAIQVIEHPNKNEYSSVVPGSDKHKYGYELKENRYFHHTTTETDGVRLGCYGYVLEGKKYSTQYVADSKGYRPVFTHDSITVYPKTGPERKASFVGDFNEDEQRSQNIRYFFPDGCKGAEFNAQGQPSTQVFVKENSIKAPFAGKSIPPPEQVVLPPAPVLETQPPKPPVVITKAPTVNKPPVVLTGGFGVTSSPFTTTLPPKSIIDRISVTKPKTDGTCSKSCCDDDKPKITLPVPLKGKSGGGDSCNFGKLIIPVEGLDANTLQSLASGGDAKELIKSILQSLG